MKTLLLLRHAKSSWNEPGLSDHDRPLNKRGHRDAPRMGRLLLREELVPDAVLSSTALRARTTAAIIAEHSGFAGEIQLDRELYHAPPRKYFHVLSRLPGDCSRVLAVGHNPGIEELLEQLTAVDEAMPTAALALVQIEIDHWSECTPGCQAHLVELWRPKELDDKGTS